MGNLIDISTDPVKKTLKILLQDKTTKQNIIWATDAYDSRPECRDVDQIQEEHLVGMDPVLLQPRISKALEEQQERAHKNDEWSPICVSWRRKFLDDYSRGEIEILDIEQFLFPKKGFGNPLS